MSELDRLRIPSMSGVPMRPRAPAPPTPAVDVEKLASVIATSNEKLVATMANMLASRQSAETPQRRTTDVEFEMTDGKITGGYVSNGTSTWKLVITRNAGGISLTTIPIDTKGP
jgi:hypothetical protein